MPKISEIACYRIVVDQNKKDSGKADFQIGKQELLADRVIRFPQPQADVFSQCWRRLSFDSGMVPLIGKHYPEVGIVFRDSDKVVCRTSISWVSSTVQFQYASGEYHIYGFDPNTGSARRLKQLLINNKLLSTNPQRLRDRLRRKQDGKIIDQLKNMD